MRKLPSGWYLLGWLVSGFLMFLSGFFDGNVVTMIVGVVVAFGFTSAYLTSHVKSEHRLKRTLEVVFTLLTFGTVIFGYVMTGSLLLGVITLFIVAMVLFAFVASYLLPRMRSGSKSLVHVKEEGEEKDDFAYDVGKELGMEMRRGFEENWRSYVIAGVIAVGCGLLLISLKSSWFIVGLSAFISYGIAYYSLSTLFEKNKRVTNRK